MYVELARYDYITEAYIAHSALQSAGFDSFIQNYYHGTLGAGYLDALGGMQVLLPEDQYQDAVLYLRTLRNTAELDPAEALPYRKWGLMRRWLTAVIAIWLLELILPIIILISIDIGLVPGFIIRLLLNILNPMTNPWFYIVILGVSAMIVHARGIALPRIQKARS